MTNVTATITTLLPSTWLQGFPCKHVGNVSTHGVSEASLSPQLVVVEHHFISSNGTGPLPVLVLLDLLTLDLAILSVTMVDDRGAVGGGGIDPAELEPDSLVPGLLMKARGKRPSKQPMVIPIEDPIVSAHHASLEVIWTEEARSSGIKGAVAPSIYPQKAVPRRSEAVLPNPADCNKTKKVVENFQPYKQ